MRCCTIFRALFPPLFVCSICIFGFFAFIGMPAIAIPFAVGAFLMSLDLYGRTNDLIYLSSRPPEYFTPKVLDRYGRSWCGRSIVVALQPDFKIYYRAMKYRWYHLLPDGSLSKNSPFLRLSFWINLSQGHKR